MDVLLKFWPLIATMMAVGSPVVAWGVVTLWRIAQGVKDVQVRLSAHEKLHDEHKRQIGELDTKVNASNTRLAVLQSHTPKHIEAV